MDMTSWCTENSVESKLMACLENIRVGRGWQVFEGLEKGSCTIKVVHDGDSIMFVSTKAKKVKAEPVVLVNDRQETEPLEPSVEEVPEEAQPTITTETELISELDGVKPTADVTKTLKPRRSTKK